MSKNNDICNFLIYENGLLKYSKFNFNFTKYATARNYNKEASKLELFNDFLNHNETDLTKPYSLKEELKQFFDPITETIKSYVSKYGVILPFGFNKVGIGYPVEFVIEHQFELYPYSDNIRVIDFLLVYLGKVFDTKFTFKYDDYINEFKITDKKITVFTDFLYRNYKLAADPKYIDTFQNLIDGYVVQPNWQKFFITNDVNNTPALGYAILYSVYSNNGISSRNIDNINYAQYIALNKLPIPVSEAKEHFLTTGQFQQMAITYYNKENQNVSNIMKATATVFIKSVKNEILNSASGFLYKDVYNNIFLVTVYNVLSGLNDINYIYGIFENGTNTNFMAQFIIIGYDKMTNILVAKYDNTLSFNNIYNPDFNTMSFLNINYNHLFYNTESVYIKGSIELNDNASFIKANILNSSYAGGFTLNDAVDMMPESLLLDSIYYKGLCGSPVLIGDINVPNSIEISGMVVGCINGQKNLTIAIKHYILINLIVSIINRYNLLTNYDKISIVNLYSDITLPRSWLGATIQNNHPFMYEKYPELNNLPYVGGLLLTNMILGFNKKTLKFVYSVIELSDKNVIPLHGPLINYNIYDKFIKGGNVPIVIKSIIYYDNVYNEPELLYFGKFGKQQPFSRFIYGQKFINIYKNDPKYFNPYRLGFVPLKIYYYYYDGVKWIEDNIGIGHNDPSFYSEYIDNNGRILLLHKFEYPSFLDIYTSSYSISNNNILDENIMY